MVDYSERYQSHEPDGGFVGGNSRRKRRARQRYRERRSREFLETLNRDELKALQKEMVSLVTPADGLIERSGLEIFEAIRRRGLGWINKVRAKR